MNKKEKNEQLDIRVEKQRDVVLVDSLSYSHAGIFPQIGLLSLRQVLQEHYSVELINFDFLWETGTLKRDEKFEDLLMSCTDYIISFHPTVVGFYTICDSYHVTVLLAQCLKERNKEINIVFGGPHASLTANESMCAFDCIDYVSVGEGEKSLPMLVKALMEKSENAITQVPNLVYRSEGDIIENPVTSMLLNKELERYTVKDYSEFEDLLQQTMSIEVGRGCPFQCSFCSTSKFWGKTFRIKSVEEITEEMKYFHKRYGIMQFKFEHDMFTCNKNYIMSFCRKVRNENMPFTWTCSSRIDALDADIIQAIQKANCKKMYTGIETGSQRMQRKIHKNLNMEKAKQNLAMLKKCGIEVTVSFIYGFPDETEEDLKETLDMISYLYSIGIYNVQLHLFIPLPNTEEEEKVSKDLYFDKDRINIGIEHACLGEEKVQEIIKEYPLLFSQFYTFHTQVRDNYSTLSFFVMYLSSAIGSFSCSMKYLIRKYGLFALYHRWNSLIQETWESVGKNSFQKCNYEDRFKNTKAFLLRCISYESEYTLDEEFRDYYYAEKQLYEFEISDKKYDTVEFTFDYTKAKNEEIYIRKQTFIMLKKS